MGRRRISAIAVGIAIALSLLGGCGDDSLRHDSLSRGDQYVAIGDSYTSAPRTGPMAANDRCMRSSTNYPHQVADKLGLELVDVSCNGASTQHVTEPQVLDGTRHPPQVTPVSASTDLVTISLGGNDFGVLASVMYSCAKIRETDPSGDPCTAADAATDGKSVEARIPQIEARLVGVIQLIAKRAPKARLVVVGYPQFFPAVGPCPELPLADGDYRFAHRVNALLAKAQRNAAEKTNVDYVDLYEATAGHDMCADEPWIAGQRPTRSDGYFYHPFPEEQRVAAKLLIDLLG